MATSENLDRMEDGATAAHIIAELDPILRASYGTAISELVAMYRGHSLSHDVMVGKIGEISALMYLQDALESRRQRGIDARGKELTNGA
jgi:hypothetical protein